MARTKSEDGKVSKAAAYRDAAAKLGDKADLDAVQTYIKETHNIVMDKAQISQYRSNERTKLKKGKRRKSKETAATTAPKSVRGDSLIEYISTVESWKNKLGAEKIVEVISVLLKGR